MPNTPEEPQNPPQPVDNTPTPATESAATTLPPQPQADRPLDDASKPSASPAPQVATKKSKKYFIYSAIIFGILLGAISSAVVLTVNLFATPTPSPTPVSSTPTPSPVPDPMANWQSFVEDRVPWTMKYPAGWYVIQNSATPHITGFSDGTALPPASGSGQVLVDVSVGDFSSNKILEREVGYKETGTELVYTILEKSTFNGYPMTRLRQESSSSAKLTPVYAEMVFIAGPQDVTIRVSSLKYRQPGYKHDEFTKEYLPVFNQMLTTFAYANPTSTPVVSTSPVPSLSVSSASPSSAAKCTQEALQCPNGTYVQRQGPRCEFTPCPPAL